MNELPGLLAKWICHDLATPTATVMTASELLAAGGDAEINELVQAGARRLVGRLRLLRAAFGPGGAPMGAKALEKLLREGLDGTPVTWQRPADSSGAEVALVAGAALLLADLARGRGLVVAANSVHWADAHALPDAVSAALAGEAATDARSAVAAMVAGAAGRTDVALTATADGIGWG